MNKGSMFAATAFLAIAAGLQGCVTTAALDTPGSATPTTTPTRTVTRDVVTVENLLRWPLEGPRRADATIDELEKRFDLKPLTTGDLSGQGPFRLEGGFVLSFISVNPATRDIDVGLDEAPCYPAADAAAAIDASPSLVTQDAHGEDRGKTYDAQRNGMRVRFTTTPVTYRCVTSIHVHTSLEAQP